MIATLAETALTSDSGPFADTNPPAVLVVEDSPVQRRLIGAQVEKASGMRVMYASDGAEALQVVERESPLAVLTDLQMPGMSGMELVERMRDKFPAVPVIVMTAGGSEEAAIAALRSGAANYIPKRYLRAELTPVLEQILTAAKIDRRRYELMGCVAELDCRFELQSDPALVPLLVAHLQEQAERMGLCDKNGKVRLGVALEEALLNGLYHGNLEVGSELKEDGGELFHRTAHRRRHEEPYRGRRLHVHARLDREQARFTIRDEGPGFDLACVPDPTDPENLLRPSGRGLMLIRMFMDAAVHNAAGNELSLTMRRK